MTWMYMQDAEQNLRLKVTQIFPLLDAKIVLTFHFWSKTVSIQDSDENDITKTHRVKAQGHNALWGLKNEQFVKFHSKHWSVDEFQCVSLDWLK